MKIVTENYIRIEDLVFQAYGGLSAFVRAESVEWEFEAISEIDNSKSFAPNVAAPSFRLLKTWGFKLMDDEFHYKATGAREFFFSSGGDLEPIESFDVEFYRKAGMPFGNYKFEGRGIVDQVADAQYMYNKPCFVSLDVKFRYFQVSGTISVGEDILRIRRLTGVTRPLKLLENGLNGDAFYEISQGGACDLDAS